MYKKGNEAFKSENQTNLRKEALKGTKSSHEWKLPASKHQREADTVSSEHTTYQKRRRFSDTG